ncbi:hypothetical protein PF007_g29724, partial [Phytophthora fragariae]
LQQRVLGGVRRHRRGRLGADPERLRLRAHNDPVALYVIYPTSKSTETQLESVTIGPITDYEHEASISVVITTNTQEGQALARKSNFDRKDSFDFVAIRSPMTRQLSSISRH